jgi:hypothetical protein
MDIVPDKEISHKSYTGTTHNLTLYRCCGSGSAFIWLSWIRIRVGMRIRIQELAKIYNKPVSCLSKRLLYLRRYVFPLTNFRYIFHVKNQLFVSFKSDQDPDPDPHWSGFLDPDRVETNGDLQHCLVWQSSSDSDLSTDKSTAFLLNVDRRVDIQIK